MKSPIGTLGTSFITALGVIPSPHPKSLTVGKAEDLQAVGAVIEIAPA
jgi:hypothetical protein